MADPRFRIDKPIGLDLNVDRAPENIPLAELSGDTIGDTISVEYEQHLAELQLQEAEATQTDLELLRGVMGLDQSITERPLSALPTPTSSLEHVLLGDFGQVERMTNGLLVLPDEIREAVQDGVTKQMREKRFSLPSLAHGSATATDYDSRANNFSTRTNIIQLENGQRVFSVYNYPLSWAHRRFDQFFKGVAGHKRRKVSQSCWKAKFESKSRIPTFEHADPNVVLLPYIANMNAADLFRNNREMKNYGDLPWAKDLTVEDKVALGERIIKAIAAIHDETGGGWGETILQNVIITADGQSIIVDPEVEFNEGVTPAEQKMDDLKEMVYSLAAAIVHSEPGVDITNLVHRLMTSYPDQAIVQQLTESTSIKFSWLRKVQLLVHDLNYFGVSLESYQAITKAIAAYKV